MRVSKDCTGGVYVVYLFINNDKIKPGHVVRNENFRSQILFIDIVLVEP